MQNDRPQHGWSKLIVLLCVAVALAMTVRSSTAATTDPAKLVERLFREPVQPDWFAPAFLAQIPAEKIATGIKQLTGQFGALREVTGSGGEFVARLDRADIPVRIALDTDGRITGLFLQAPIPTTGSLDEYARAIAALPGSTSVLVLTDGTVRADQDADVPLAVGSAMKLAILAALDDAVKAGRLAWDKVVPLDAGWRTLPTGVLIDWPAGTPVTIATLANLMISISDNMAADALISIVGRAPIEAITPRNKPFPTTSEIFKLQTNDALRQAWQAGDDSAKRGIIGRLAALPLPRVDQLPKTPNGVEWFLSAREICSLLDRVADLPAMHINPGLADRSQWKSVAFKGGSDIGVVNFSIRLVGNDGKVHCVVATWNNDVGVDLERLAVPCRAILRQLRTGN